MKRLITLMAVCLSLMVLPLVQLQGQNTFTLGTGTIVNPNTTYPSPYGQWYTGDKVQYLIRASELNALGVGGGNLLSIGFNLQTAAPPTSTGANLNGFTIKGGLTTATSLTGWLPTTTTLWTASQYVSTIGWNTHTFTTPFFWDGVSNIVIETCYDNYTGTSDYSYNAMAYQSTTTFTSVLDYHSDGGGVCSSTAAPTTYSQRPNMQLTFAPNLAIDAGMSAITSPVTPVSPGIATVKGTIRNYGVDTVTSATIGWSVNGVSQTTVPWTGSLPAMGQDTGIVLGTYNFPLGTHTIKAWTTLPNGVTDSSAFNDTTTASLICANVLNGIYYVGGAGADYATLNQAIGAASAAGVSGPVTFKVNSGTYLEQMTIPPIMGVNSTNTLTFEATSGNPADVIIKHNAGSGNNWTLQLNGADYINFNNLTFIAEDSSFARVVHLQSGADYNSFNNCVFISQPMARANTSSACIYDGTGLDNFNVITNCELYNGYYGIYAYGGGSASSLQGGWIFQDNLVKDYFYYGIYFYYQDAPDISGNRVENHPSSAYVYPLTAGYCQNELKVLKNRVFTSSTNYSYGLRIYYCTAAFGTEGLIANNMVSQYGQNSATNYGVYIYYSNYQKVYNNSALIQAGGTGSAAGYYYYGGNISSQNNVYVNTTGGYAVYVSGTPIYLSNYNNYFSTGLNLGYWTTNVATLAALQTTSGQDANSTNINPEFFMYSALYPFSVAMNNLGSPLAEVTDDIDGKLRSTTAPDMGCVEYTPPQNDVGIISVDSPTSPNAPGSHTVNVTLKNFGIANLTSANLSFSVNGSAPVSTVWVGNLATGGTDGPVTIGSFNFPYGANELKVWGSNPNLLPDENPLNDTLVVIITVCDLLDSTYTIGDTALGADYPSFAAAINAMTSCGIGGTVTFNVWPGTYNEQVTIPVIPGSSFANRVMFQSSTGVASDVVVQYAPTSTTNNWVWGFAGADYIDVQNITIQATPGSTYGYVVQFMNNSSYNYMGGNIIRTNSTSTSSYFAGIYSSSASKDEYNVFSNNTIYDGYYGIYFYGPSNLDLETGNVFEGNTINGFYYYGLYMYNQYAVMAIANKITNSLSSATCYGLYQYYCDGPSMIVRNRVQLTNTSTGYVFQQYYCDATLVEPALIANNWFMATNPSMSAGRPMTSYYSMYQQFYHNSAANYATSTSSYPFYMYASTSTPSSIELVNNIFANLGNGAAIYINATTTLPMVTWGDYNDLFTNGSNIGYAGTNQSNLAAWQAATGLDSNSVSVNPMFLSNNFLQPGAPALDNLGFPLIQVSDDIFGNTRSFTTPDIGAVEFTPPQDDAGIISIDSPGSPIGPGSYQITATIKNFGLVNLSTAYINYSINGGPSSSMLWVGPISPDSTDGPVLITSYNFPYGLHTLKVWTSNPNNAIDGNHLNDTATVVINVCDIISGTFAIGDTSTGADFPTFQSAINSLSSCGIGDTVLFLVDSGTYVEQVSIPQIPGAGPGARVIFAPASGNANDVKLTFAPPTSTLDYVLLLNGADYVTFRDMTIMAADSGITYGRTVKFAGGANYNEFLNCKIQTQVTTSSYFAAVYATASMDGHNLFDGCEIKGGYYGFYLYGAGSGPEGNTIINCDIIDWYYYGVYLQYQTTPIVKHNYLHNSPSSGYAYAIRNYYNYGPFETSYNTIELDGTGYGYGLYIYYSDGQANNPAKVYNNVVMVNNGSGAYGAYFYYATNVKFYHNTINTNITGTYGYGLYMGYMCSNIDVVNNSVTSSNYYAVYVSAASYVSGFSHMDYNNLFSAGASVAYLGGALTTLADWQAATTLDSNSISSDPAFYSLTNLTPSVGTVNNLGTPVAWITDDLHGNARNVTNPDMGAIEFDPLAWEAGLVAIVGPVSGCDLGNEYVAFEIVNRGSNTITDSLYATYVLDGTSISVTELVTDTINPNDTVVFTFTTPVNVSTLTDTAFSFHGWINLAGDPLPENDSAMYSMISNLSPMSPMVIGDTVQQGSAATLMVANPSPTQSYSWYANPTSTTPVHVGDTFVTPALNTTTVYYVEGLEGSAFQDFQTGPGTSSNYYAPANGWYNYSWSATIYKASEMNTSGRIDQLAFNVSNAVNFVMLNQKIWLSHTTDSLFTTTAIPTTVGTQVFQGDLVWIGPGWFTINLDVPFMYNGTDNLMVYWENWDGSYTSGYPTFTNTTTTSYMTKHDYSDTGFPYSLNYGGLIYNRPDIQLIGGDNGCPSARTPDTAYVTSPIIAVNAGNDTSMCAGGSVQLNVTASGGLGSYTYAWSPASSLNNATIANPIATPVTNTTYSVTVTDGNGDTGSDDIIVLVNPGPNVTLAALPNICVNYVPYTFNQGSPAGGVYSGPGVTAGVFYPGTAGVGTHIITYTYTDPATGCSGSATKTIFVDDCIGMENIENGLGLSVYPNPSAGMVTVSLYSEESSVLLSLMDVTGKVVFEERVLNTQGLMSRTLDLGTLPRGVYTLRLQGAEHSTAEKLVLR
jgi:hypothetical protein